MRFKVGDRVRFHWRSAFTDVFAEGCGQVVHVSPGSSGPGLYKVESEDHGGARFYVTENEVFPATPQ